MTGSEGTSPSRFSGVPRAALDDLLPEVYTELRCIARRELSRERTGHTLDSAALVHEAYLKLARQDAVRWQNRSHFLAIASRAMRTVLIDYARGRQAAKRGGGTPGAYDALEQQVISDADIERLIVLDDALSRLERVNAEACDAVECRYFGGLTLGEYARVSGISLGTARRRWSFAKTWLREQLAEHA